MRRMYLFGTMTLAMLAMIGLAACSNSHSTDPDEKEAGSLNDPEFQQAVATVGMAELFSGYGLEGIMGQIGEIDGMSASPQLGGFRSSLARPAADSFYATYNGTTEYWTVYMSVVDSGMSFVYRDSLQFRAGNSVLQWPDSTVDEIRAGGALAVSETGTNNSVAIGQIWTIVGDIVNEGDVTVNGTGVLAFDVTDGDSTGTCSFDLDFTSTWDDVDVNLAGSAIDDCPTGGTIRHEGTVDVSCVSDEGSLAMADSWTAQATFSGGNVSAVWENSTHRWTYDGPCSEMP